MGQSTSVWVRFLLTSYIKWTAFLDHNLQKWCSSESTHLPPLWPGFISRTPGTTCPNLFDKCVGLLTSPADYITLKMQETGPRVYSPYPRRPECLTICRYNYKLKAAHSPQLFGVTVGWVCCWFSSLLQGFFSRFSSFPPSTKTNTPNSNLIQKWGPQFCQLCCEVPPSLIKVD